MTRVSEPLGVAGGQLLATAQAAKSGGSVQCRVNGVLRTVQVFRDLTVAAGDVLVVHRIGGVWVASGRLGTAAPAYDPPDADMLDPNPPTYAGTLTVLPATTGTYRDGAWVTSSTDLQQGIRGGYGNATGAAFYGVKPRSLSGATVTAARLTGVARNGVGALGATASTLRLITESARPAGAPTLTSTTAGPSIGKDLPPVDFTVPTAWAQSMVDGTAGGVGFFDADGSPFLQFAGRGASPSAFTLVIDWTRTV